MSSHPKVSVVSITYNQEDYIRETLDGFLKQKTNFSFEIVIADDCSTDKTPAIIKEYARANPDIFKPILRTKNLGPWQNFTDALRAATGDYIAVCEGDDYWTDERKLQLQADFLDSKSDYAICFHPVKVYFEDRSQADYVFPKRKKNFTIQALLEENFIQTNSVMYRRQNYEDLAPDMMPGDWYLHAYHAQFGKIGFIDQVMSVYRVHPGGIWWSAHMDREKLWREYGLAHLNLYMKFLKMYGDKPAYRRELDHKLTDTMLELAMLDGKAGSELATQAAREFPEAARLLIMKQQQDIRQREQSIQILENKNLELARHADNLTTQLGEVLDSKAYQLSRKAGELKHKIAKQDRDKK